MLKLFFLAINFLLLSAHASVWEDTREWSAEAELEFAAWMRSEAVHEYMFTKPTSPYYGISVDCADASYALRAIFAFHHQLPFVIVNPSGSRGTNPTLNNRMNNWDHTAPGIPRLIAMINEIAMSVGTDNLAYLDSYPIMLKNIRPGTVFVSRKKIAEDYSVKHAFNIKAVNPGGTFDVIYSSEAIQAGKMPMQRRKDREMDVLPSDPYGFRQFRWPAHLNRKIKDLPLELNASFEQFELAARLNIHQFNKVVRQRLATIKESDNERLERMLKAVCQEAQSRIAVINLGELRRKALRGECMNFQDYDIYSTPARDASLKEAFMTLEKNYLEIKDTEGVDHLDPRTVEFAEIILMDRFKFDEELKKWCPIEYLPGTTIDLAELWKRVYFSRLSSHPNDIVATRWGEEATERTTCKRWY